MAKKTYIKVERNDNRYRVYMEDVKKIHKIAKKERPPLPHYDK